MKPRTAASLVASSHLTEAFTGIAPQGDKWRVYQLLKLAGDGTLSESLRRISLRLASRLSREGEFSRRQALAVAEAAAALQVEDEETAARHAMMALEEVWPADREYFLRLIAPEADHERWVELLDTPISISLHSLAVTAADIEGEGGVVFATLPDPRKAQR